MHHSHVFYKNMIYLLTYESYFYARNTLLLYVFNILYCRYLSFADICL